MKGTCNTPDKIVECKIQNFIMIGLIGPLNSFLELNRKELSEIFYLQLSTQVQENPFERVAVVSMNPPI